MLSVSSILFSSSSPCDSLPIKVRVKSDEEQMLAVVLVVDLGPEMRAGVYLERRDRRQDGVKDWMEEPVVFCWWIR